MTDREKLIALLCEAMLRYDRIKDDQRDNPFHVFADHLLANGVTFQKWIPVSERLPEDNTAVIVATDNGMVFQCLYAYDGWDLWDGYKVNITHWMPLPEPPEEDN